MNFIVGEQGGEGYALLTLKGNRVSSWRREWLYGRLLLLAGCGFGNEMDLNFGETQIKEKLL